MSVLCAVTGKGGVGKTTISALLIRQLIKNGRAPVLAIDADPNSCLDTALGVTVTGTVGSAREEVRAEADALAKSGVSKQEMLQLKIAESLVEADDFDLIAMGRPEGAGCYCYANNVLKSVITQIADEYPYVVLDNEAGLENLSRRIISTVDTLMLVSDASGAGLKTLARLHALAVEMGVTYNRLILVVNRLRGQLPPSVDDIVQSTGAAAVIALPDDPQVAEYAEQNRCLLNLPDDNPVVERVDEMVRRFF